MPVLSAYAYIGPKHHRVFLLTITEWPMDWADHKRIMTEAAIILYQERKITNVLATLELHLPGKFVWKHRTGGYSEQRVRYRREVEWSGHMSFHPNMMLGTDQLELKECMFGPHLYKVLASDYYFDRGVKYKVGSLIPRLQQNISGDVKSLLMEPSAVRYADYTVQPKSTYNLQVQQPTRRSLYEPSCVRSYLPPGLQIREETD